MDKERIEKNELNDINKGLAFYRFIDTALIGAVCWGSTGLAMSFDNKEAKRQFLKESVITTSLFSLLSSATECDGYFTKREIARREQKLLEKLEQKQNSQKL